LNHIVRTARHGERKAIYLASDPQPQWDSTLYHQLATGRAFRMAARPAGGLVGDGGTIASVAFGPYGFLPWDV
jgi:hypothetical protein